MTRHILLLTKFIIFNILLPGADFITDCLAAQKFYAEDSFNFFILTMIPIFLPMAARFILVLVNMLRAWNNPAKRDIHWETMMELPLHLPLIQQLR